MSAEPAVSAGLSDWFAGEPTAKIAPHIPRTTPLETTLLRAEIAARSLPITRLADLTPLDRLGLPVFCAVTPLARDLTTHMGKGLTPMAARVSAIMEAIERIAAERPPPESRRTSRTALLAEGKKALDPKSLALPPDTAYTADATLAWSPAVDLGRAGTPIWLPTDLVICPALDGVIGQADTNGLASGNTRLEAVLHGLCEVIERDAAGRFLFADLYAEPGDRVMPPRRIDPRTMPQESRALVDRMAGEGLQIVIQDITQDIGIPVIRVVALDPAFPAATGPVLRRFPGYGCDPSARIALSRAITEAAQSRVAVLQGARDSYNTLPATDRPIARKNALADLQDVPGIAFDSIPNFVSDCLAEDLRLVLDRLAAAGHDTVLAVDLEAGHEGLSVVRVRVPGLGSFFVDHSRAGPAEWGVLV